MAFCLVNAPTVFQGMMNMALADCITKGYIDDIIVYSKTHEEHVVARLDAVFSAIEANRLVYEPSKCFMEYRKIVHPGHLVGAGGIRFGPSKTRAIGEYPEPRKHERGPLLPRPRRLLSRIRRALLRARHAALRSYSRRLAIVLGVSADGGSLRF